MLHCYVKYVSTTYCIHIQCYSHFVKGYCLWASWRNGLGLTHIGFSPLSHFILREKLFLATAPHTSIVVHAKSISILATQISPEL